MFVLEYTFQHDEFLPAGMNVAGKVAAGIVANDGCRARDLIADPIQHPTTDTLSSVSPAKASCRHA